MIEDGVCEVDGGGDRLGLIEPLVDKLLGIIDDPRLGDGVSGR